jgi:hypothetical protein
MTHTFDIRFARSAGLAGLFEAPTNSFGWRGRASLSIDERGLHFSPRGGLLTLAFLRRTQHIDASSLLEVIREVEALRVEFAGEGRNRGVVPFRARDRDTAAEIVRLLPTTRTIEMEFEVGEAEGGGGAKRRPMRALLIGAAALLLIGVIFTARWIAPPTLPLVTKSIEPISKAETAAAVDTGDTAGRASIESTPANEPPAADEVAAETVSSRGAASSNRASPEAATLESDNAIPAAATPVASAAVENAAPETEGFVPYVPEIRLAPQDLVVPIPQGTLAYDSAHSLLARFEAGAAHLTDGYREDRKRADQGVLKSKEFASKLDSYAVQWRDLRSRLLENAESRDPALTGFRATLAAVVSYQISFLTAAAAGFRADDKVAIELSLLDLARAEEMLDRARLYLR